MLPLERLISFQIFTKIISGTEDIVFLFNPLNQFVTCGLEQLNAVKQFNTIL